jgi:F-type H+-transporting ATPase subunit alpha
MKKVSGTLKLEYSQYKELQAFAQFGSDLDADTKSRLANGERIVEVLKQGKNAPVSVENQILIIFAVINNFLKDVAVSKVAEYEAELFKHMENNHSNIIDIIKTEKDITPDTAKELKTALSKFTEDFVKNNA